MLHPVFDINFGWIPIYFIMLVAAFFAGLIVLNVTMKHRNFSRFTRKQMMDSYLVSAVAGVICSNAASWLLLDDIDRSSFYNMVADSGFSLYFGLLSFSLSVVINARLRRYMVKSVVSIFVPSLMMIHLFARMGCMLKGCCYGSMVTINGTEIMFPVREIECGFVLVTFIVLIATTRLTFFKRLPIYLFSYSVVRFVLEFFRGDDRGSMLGIEALSPAQIISLIIFFIIGLNWLALLILKLTHNEEKARSLFANLKNKIFRKNQGKPRILRTFDCQEPVKRVVVIPVLLSVASAFCLLVYFNPFNISFLDTIRFSVEDAVSGFFNEEGTQEEIGSMNGSDLLYIGTETKISDRNEALTLVTESGYFDSARLAVVEEKQLPNHKKAYFICQTVNGKNVLGSNYVLVVDEKGVADYIIGDDTSVSYTSEVSVPYSKNAITLKDLFGENIRTLSQTACYYDSGDGLVDVYHVMVSENGSATADFGAVVRADNGNVISLTPATGVVASENRIKISLITQLMIDSLKEAEKGKPVSIGNSALTSGNNKELQNLVRAMENAYNTSGLSPAEFSLLLQSVGESINGVDDISIQKFSSIITHEVRYAQIVSGSGEKEADACADKVSRAFTSNGFKETKDENITRLTVTERKSTFKHKINYENDEDVYTFDIEEKHSLSVAVRTDKPVLLEVYNNKGDAVLSAYVESNEEISLYREDGTSFTMRITDSSLENEFRQGGFNYRVSVQGIATPDIPKEISNLLKTVEDSYNRSNIVSFASVAMNEGKLVSIGEALAVGTLGALGDSCAGSCVGIGDGVDTVKTTIAAVTVPNGNQLQALSYLKGTTMELEYFDHKTDGNTSYICAKLLIAMDGMSVYDGYCYMLAEYITKESLDSYSDSVGNEELDKFFSLVQGDKYYIKDFNNDQLYSVFGVTNGIPESDSDLESLYDLWETGIMTATSAESPSYSAEIPYMYIDRARALAAGHSEEKVDGFEEYIARQNLMKAKMERMILAYQRNTFLAIAALTDPVTDIIGLITDPVGGSLDILCEQNSTANNIWNAIKFIKSPSETIKDIVKDEVTNALVEESKAQAEHFRLLITVWDQVIIVHTETLNKCTNT